MAEVLLVVHGSPDPASYQDGDIAIAFNRRRIRQVHAQHICHVQLVPFNSDGLNPIDSLAYEFRRLTHQFRLQRIGPSNAQGMAPVLCQDLLTDEQTFSIVALDQYLRNQMKDPLHTIFGTRGAEVWFGGRKDVSHAALDKVWEHIEGHTPHRESDHTRYPHGHKDLKRFLALPTEDFTDAEREAYAAPLFDVDGTKVSARAHGIEYQALLSPKELEDVKDADIEVDVREVKAALDMVTATRQKTVAEVRDRIESFSRG